MIETVTRKVAPQEEQQTINLMATFGWDLMSSQEINNSESHLERRDDAIYNVTTRENYVKLLFQRDTDRKNYQKIVDLESQYFSILKSKPEMSKSKLLLSFVIAFATMWLAMIPGILFGYFQWYKPYKEKYAKWSQKLDTTGRHILAEAQQLL